MLDEDEMTATRRRRTHLADSARVPDPVQAPVLSAANLYPEQLLEEFSGYESESSLRTVDVHITNIRAKTRRCTGFQIVTVRGLGYKAVIE